MQLDEGDRLERLRKGESFGWDGWLLGEARAHTVRALTHVDLYYLSCDDISNCLHFFPDLKGVTIPLKVAVLVCELVSVSEKVKKWAESKREKRAKRMQRMKRDTTVESLRHASSGGHGAAELEASARDRILDENEGPELSPEGVWVFTWE